jgi:hypothetical protein
VVGWNALWLAFLGVCVWGYILFFRPADGPQRAHAEPARQHAAEPKADAHGASGHGEPAPKRDAKSRAPRKPTAKKAAPSGGH